MSELRISLFGTPALIVDGRRLQHRSRKAMALLAYLAMRAGEPATRAHLASLLWADSAEEQARTNLRQTLSLLRKLFRQAGHDPLLVPFDQVVLQRADVRIDAAALLDDHEVPDIGELASGPAFLEGFSVQAPNFNSWVAATRLSVEGRLCDLLKASAEKSLLAGDAIAAATNLAAILRLDPLREDVHRMQMRALDALGRKDAALQQFDALRNVLQRELSIEPDHDSRDLARRIRSARLQPNETSVPAKAFNRYPPARPALVIHRPANSSAAREGQFRLCFADGDAALAGALEVSRQISDPATLLIVVIADLGDGDANDDRARALFDLAEPGAILVDAAVYRQFEQWSPYMFESMATHNGTAPAYRLISEMVRHRLQVAPSTARPQKAAAAGEFSIAVLPFRDYSPNASSFALGDVVAEEVIGRLARFRNLTVAAPSASQTCRAFNLRPDQIRETLGVNYLIDGNIHRDGDELRLNLTMTDFRDGTLSYSDRFEGSFGRIFDHQGQFIDRVATAIFRNAEQSEVMRAVRTPTDDIGAYEWYLKGLAAHRRSGISPDNAREAFAHFSRAIELDPDYARALAWRICSIGWYAPEYYVEPGLAEIHHALSIDEHDAEVRRIAGALHLYRGDYDDGIRHIEHAVALNPSDAYLLASSAVYWAYKGEPENGLKYIERALKLDPFLPVWCVEDHGVVLYTMEDFSGAIGSLQRLSVPTTRGLCYLAAAQIASGEDVAAKRSVERIRQISRDYSVDELMMTNYYRRDADKTELRRRLNRAGLD